MLNQPLAEIRLLQRRCHRVEAQQNDRVKTQLDAGPGLLRLIRIIYYITLLIAIQFTGVKNYSGSS